MKDVEHRCKALPGNGLGVYRAEHFLDGENWEWCLVVERLATESDLGENHYLENIGDTIWATAVGISYCPFCGALLPDAERSVSSLAAGDPTAASEREVFLTDLPVLATTEEAEALAATLLSAMALPKGLHLMLCTPLQVVEA